MLRQGDGDAGFAEMTQKEVERLQQMEEDFNQFLHTEGKGDRVYLVAFKAGELQARGRSAEDQGGRGGGGRGSHHGR